MIKLKTFSYIDRDVAGIEAFRMLIPNDWKFEGGIRWILDNPAMPATLMFRVGNGVDEFEFLPYQAFYWTTDPTFFFMRPRYSKYFGNEVQPPIAPERALRDIVVPRFRGGLKLKIIKEEPSDIAKFLRLEGEGNGSKIKIEYERNGILIEEDIYCIVKQLEFPNIGGLTKSIFWSVDSILSFKAKKGLLEDSKILQTIARSFKLNPLWQSKYQQMIQYLTQMQIQQIRHTGELSRIMAQTNNEIGEDIAQRYHTRQDAMDRSNKEFSHYIRGTEEYYDTTQEKTVELPSGHDDVWANNLGEYILSDSPNYNPNTDKDINNLNWTRIKKA